MPLATTERLEAIRTWPDTIPPPERTLGWIILAWTADHLRQPDGPNAGQPWEYTLEQARILLRLYEIDAQGRFVHRRAVLRRMKGWGKDPFLASIAGGELCGPCRFSGWAESGLPTASRHSAPWIQVAAVSKDQTRNTMTLFPGLFAPETIDEYGVDLGKEIIYARGGGRIEAVTSSPRALEGGRPSLVIANEALALDTLLPTPEGWTTVGGVQVGDLLLGSTRPTRVIHTTPVYKGRSCFNVRFEDGSEMVADEGHLWQTMVVGSDARPKIRTTGEMLADGRRFAVPLPGAIEGLPPVGSPIDPYVLGLWLGDGDASAAGVTLGAEDMDLLLPEVRRRGVPGVSLTRTTPGRPKRMSLRGNASGEMYTKNQSSIRAGLVALDVLNNKHVPTRFLRGSLLQRLDLLRGLMDSDGCATSRGQAVFVNQNRRLAAAVEQLARSLGNKVTRTEVVDRRWSSPRLQYRVSFRPDSALNPFLLPRKAVRVRPGSRRWKTITSITHVPSVRVRCIEVDAPDHLFVAGEGWTLTHNTHHWLPSNDGIEMARAIRRNAGKSRDGAARVVEITNAHLPGEGSSAEETYEAWRQADGNLPGVYYDSLEAPIVADGRGNPVPLSELDDETISASLLCARGDSSWVSVERLLAEIRDPVQKETITRRFYFNQVTGAGSTWLPDGAWDDCADPQRSIEPGARVTLGFDGARSHDITALVVVSVEEVPHIDVVATWERPIDPVEAVDWKAPRDEIKETIRDACREWEVLEIAWDEYLWLDAADELEEEGLPVVSFPQQMDRMGPATQRFYDAVVLGSLTHSGDPDLARHVANAKTITNSRGTRIVKDKKDSPRKIDLAVAAVMAFEAASTVPLEEEPHVW